MAKVRPATALNTGHVTITGFADPLVQATARVVQIADATQKNRRRVIDPSQHRLERATLDRVLAWRDKSERGEATPLDRLSADYRKLLDGPEAQARLAQIAKAIDEAAKMHVEAPLFLAIQVELIKDPVIRACATAIAESYGTVKAKGVLTIGQLATAWNDLQLTSGTSGVPSSDFATASANPAFTPHNVEALRVYMVMGLGGLMNHGSLEGHDVKLHKVFQLPLLAQVQLPDGKPYQDQSADRQRAILQTNIDNYEQRFGGTGIDRVYVLGDDGLLYCALHDDGPLTGLREGARLAFNDPSKPLRLDGTRMLGEVLRVVDVNNTLREASLGFWGRTFASWGEALNGLFRSASEKPLTAISTVSDHLKPDSKTAAGAAAAISGGGVSPWLAAAGLAGLAAAIPNTNALLNFLGITAAVVGVSATGLSIWHLLRTGKNVGPFLDATGHVVNRAAIRADDV